MKWLLLLTCFLVAHPLYAKGDLIKPDGYYNVGVQDIHVISGKLINKHYRCQHHSDFFRKQKNDFSANNRQDFCREMVLRIYYPAKHEYQAKHAHYHALPNMESFASKNAPIYPHQFPTILFVPRQDMLAQDYENILTQLASHGYIVIGINSPFFAKSLRFPDGHIVQSASFKAVDRPAIHRQILHNLMTVRREAENSTGVIGKFAKHIQARHIGVLGHVTGAYAAITAAREYYSLFRAGVSLDVENAYYTTALKPVYGAPFMRLFSAGWRQASQQQFSMPTQAKIEIDNNNFAVFLSPSSANKSYTTEMNYSDLATLQYDPTKMSEMGTANGSKTAKLINNYLVQFFDTYLKGLPSPCLAYCMALSKDSQIRCGPFKPYIYMLPIAHHAVANQSNERV